MFPLPTLPNQKPGPIPAMVWWMVWFGILAGFVMIALTLGRRTLSGEIENEMIFVGMAAAQIAASSALRWIVLPKITHRPRAFVLFIVGLALAEGGGTFGIFLTQAHRTDLIVLAALGIAQWIPLFASRYPATSS